MAFGKCRLKKMALNRKFPTLPSTNVELAAHLTRGSIVKGLALRN